MAFEKLAVSVYRDSFSVSRNTMHKNWTPPCITEKRCRVDRDESE